jgi:cellulose biosynthesis protein BcsQ
MPPTIVSVFNHKGGVSKTTTTFNLGWMLASLGHRVVLVDADPQCNLTGVTLGASMLGLSEDGAVDSDISEEEYDARSEAFSESQAESQDFWSRNVDRTLFGALRPAFESEPRLLEAVDCLPVERCDGLFLLPGHLRLGEYEVPLSVAQELSGSLTPLRNLPGAPYYLLNETAEQLDADFVLIDMSPSLGALNQNLVSISDLVVVPTAPDYFSIMALQSLARVLPRWARWARAASSNEVLRDATYSFPDTRMKVAGAVIQRYRLYRSPTDDVPYGTPTGPFREWIEKVETALENEFIPAMREANLTLPNKAYRGMHVGRGRVLAQIQEFNSLLPKSQQYRIPVFELTREELGQAGVVLEASQRQIDSLHRIFTDLASRIVTLASSAD